MNIMAHSKFANRTKIRNLTYLLKLCKNMYLLKMYLHDLKNCEKYNSDEIRPFVS